MHKPLPHEETLRLLNEAQAGDETARETLVVNNIALVKSIVKGFLGRGTDYDDLLQIGTMGLLKAIDNFNTDFKVRFSTYAVPMITGEIKRFLRDDGAIKVSRQLKENAMKIYRAEEKLKTALARDPSIEEISKETGFTPEEIILATEASRSPLSIDEPVQEDSPKATLLNTLAAEEDTETQVEKIMLKQLLSKLGPRERQVIMLRYFKDKTQSEIASIIGVSQVQVSRLLQKTLQKMKDAVADDSDTA